MKRVRPQRGPLLELIPDFCRGGALLTQAFVLQLVAIVLTLAGDARGGDAVSRLMMLTIYLQWIGVISGASLCWARSWLAVARPGWCFCLLGHVGGGGAVHVRPGLSGGRRTALVGVSAG